MVEQPLDDLLTMIRQERQGLIRGLRITIFIGPVAVGGIFKGAAIATSKVLDDHFSQNPESLDYHAPADLLSPEALRILLISWMRDTCQGFEAYAVPMQQKFAENVALLRAARILGMERYTRHILTVFVEYFKTELPSYEEITTVERNATSDKDPLWTAMVNHLCFCRYKELVPDPEDFAAYLALHPRLKQAMVEADEYSRNKARKEWEALRRSGKLGKTKGAPGGRGMRLRGKRASPRRGRLLNCFARRMEAKGGSGLLLRIC
ncbi:hypothetical protein EK21DRAFT_89932 [Setomelanomma holmii]|uniref:Uncharacterized protein n=1 Tax=Setomelanomma holmii TaxID=210430 RepID=A0A9P4LLM1_9PLEO|nr:hypothetical protein EK21DRAFT_89932 [Setomelanomma holmii]